MTNVQAAIGVAQMEELEEFIARKNRNYDIYEKCLSGVEGVSLLPFRKNIRSNKWFYSILLERKEGTDNVKTVIRRLGEAGVQTRPIWGLIHEQRPYLKDVSYKIQQAKYYSERIINVPCSTNITIDEIEKVCMAIKDAV